MHRQSTTLARRWSVVLAVSLCAALAVPATALAGGGPTITSPTDGSAAATSPLAVSATSSAPQVRFTLTSGVVLVDVKLVSVVAGTATANLDLFGVTGNTTVSAIDCTAGTCSGIEDTIGVTVALDAPVITSPSSNKVVGSSVTVKATAPGGGLAFFLDGNVVGTDVTAPFEKNVSLDGKSQGSHTITVKQCDAAGDVCEGDTDTVTIIKDTQGPKWTDLGGSPSPFYPANDGYKDSTTLSAKVSEKSSETKVEIRKQGGPIVRTLKLGRVDQGRVKATWNGRKSNGDVVPAGKYTFQFIGADVNGVVGKSNDKVVNVSDKKLVKKSATKTVTAVGSIFGNGSGSCSGLYRLDYPESKYGWAKGVGYYSRSQCNGTAAEDFAIGYHKTQVQKAVRYGSMKIETYGGGAFRHAGPGIILYAKTNDQFAANRAVSASLGWHSGPSVKMDSYLKGQAVRWGFATEKGNWYDVKEFRISYTYSVLR